jgi:hypothetical protein
VPYGPRKYGYRLGRGVRQDLSGAVRRSDATSGLATRSATEPWARKVNEDSGRR